VLRGESRRGTRETRRVASGARHGGEKATPVCRPLFYAYDSDAPAEEVCAARASVQQRVVSLFERS